MNFTLQRLLPALRVSARNTLDDDTAEPILHFELPLYLSDEYPGLSDTELVALRQHCRELLLHGSTTTQLPTGCRVLSQRGVGKLSPEMIDSLVKKCAGLIYISEGEWEVAPDDCSIDSADHWCRVEFDATYLFTMQARLPDSTVTLVLDYPAIHWPARKAPAQDIEVFLAHLAAWTISVWPQKCNEFKQRLRFAQRKAAFPDFMDAIRTLTIYGDGSYHPLGGGHHFRSSRLEFYTDAKVPSGKDELPAILTAFLAQLQTEVVALNNFVY